MPTSSSSSSSRTARRAVAVVALALLVAGCVENLGRLQNARTGPGESARDYLSSDKYTSMIVEIDATSGYGPNAEALQRLKDAFNAHLNKPGGITYDTSGIGSVPARGESAKYSFQEIDAIEERHRTHYSRGDTAALYVLYVDGGSTEDTSNGRVLGAVYHGSSMVMFKGNIKSISRSDGGLLPSTTAEERCVERAVLVHEAGHALGLVNHGIPMVTDHEDDGHPGHSSNKNSVMYYAVENSQSVFNIFGGGCSQIPYQFDANDKADMRAAGGK